MLRLLNDRCGRRVFAIIAAIFAVGAGASIAGAATAPVETSLHERAADDGAPAAKAAATLAPLSARTEFRLGLRGAEVRALKRLLAHAGFDPGDLNSDLYDLALLSAVRAFQTSRHLKSTGVPREYTIGALNEIIVLKPTPPGTAANTQTVPLPVSRPSPETTASIGDISRPTRAGVDLPILDANSVERMEQALARFQKMKEQLGKAAYKGDAGEIVARLVGEGFLEDPAGNKQLSDPKVRDALRKWQAAYGLPETASFDKSTRKTMKVPLDARIAELEASIGRARLLLPKLPSFFVLVNAAAAQLQVVHGHEAVMSMPAIVGRSSRRTPEFVSKIPYVQLNPTWTPPHSIVRRDIAPQARRDPAYLDKHNFQIIVGGHVADPHRINWRRHSYPLIVQKPGPGNALGLVRFGMSRRGAYYIHGAARPDLFKKALAERFLSSGCVRVKDPVALAQLLIDPSHVVAPPTDVEKLLHEHDGGWKPGKQIRLAQPVTTIWTYLTAWTSSDGVTHFRDDPYRRDIAVKKEAPATTVRQADLTTH